MEERAKILERIRKLLAVQVGRGASEAEAMQAALMAQKLIAQNDVEQWELAGEGEPIEEVSTTRQRPWEDALAHIVAENFRCKHYLTRYKQRKGFRWYHRFFGYRSDAEAACLVFKALAKVCRKGAEQFAERQAQRYWGVVKSEEFNAFAQYFCAGVRSELEKQSQALMLTCPPKINDAYFAKASDWKKAQLRGATARQSTEAHKEGFDAGRDAVRAGRLDASGAFFALER